MSSVFTCRDQICDTYFDEALVVGKGGFGRVYRGTINSPESNVAIKRLDLGSKQGATEFWTEIEMLSKFKHSHLVYLIGYCNDYQEMIIVYEYMSAGSLRDHLHKIGGSHCKPFDLSWLQRLKICIGAARGLDYLHTGTSIQQRVIHRDVKSSNILLDENWAAKISDFGLSKIGPANQDCTHVSTHVKGTFGYLDPEYYLTRRVTRKSDVYALGVVLLEVLCGRPSLDLKLDDEKHSLARWAKNCFKEGKLDEMIDPSLMGQILPTCLKEFAQVANQCLHNQPKKRPTMAEVVVRLEFALSLQERTDFSVLEGQIIVGAYDKQENMDSSTEHELVSPRDSGEHQEEQSDGYTRLGGASRTQKLTFIRKVQALFSMKTPVLPDMLQWPHRIVVPVGSIPVDTSGLELKPQGKLTITVVKAKDLKNMEMIGKSDPYVVVHIHPLKKVKSKVIDNNLNPVWNQTFVLIAQDKETQAVTIEVFDQNICQDKRLGVVKLPLIELEADTPKEFDLRLLPALDMLKIKDKKDRGTITVKVLYHPFTKEEQAAAIEEEKRFLEEKNKLKEAGIICSTMDAIDGAASLVGMVGTGIGAGVGLVGYGIGAGAGFVGSGLGAVGSGLSKAGKFMGRSITGQSSSSKRSGTSTPVNSVEENGGVKPR